MTAATAVLQILLTGLGALAVGRSCRGNRRWVDPPALQAAFDCALGLLLISHLVFLAALLGLAQPWFFRTLSALLAAAAVWSWVRADWRSLAAAARESLRTTPGGPWALALGLLWAGLVTALAVPPATAVDELVYHLEVPRRILEAGSTVFFPDNVYAYFPQLGEMLFTFAMALGGETAAKLVHALFGALLGLAVFGFARRFLPAHFSLLAVGFFLAIPSVLWGASLAYVDLAFALYAFLALTCLLDALSAGRTGGAAAAGLMAGAAWAVKYTGLQLTLLLLLLILLDHLIARRRGVPWSAAVFGAVAVVPALPYLLRNWMVTGWPLFPFQLPFQLPFLSLDPRMNWDPERSQLFLRWLSGFGGGLEAGAAEKLLSPVLVFFQARFDQPAAYDGVIGPVFLLIPFLLLPRPGKPRLPREVWMLIGFTVAFIYYWSLTTQQVRFLLPAAPVLAVLLAFGLHRRGVVWRLTAAVLVLVGLGMGSEKLMRARPWAWWSGAEDRGSYLENRVVGFRLYERANQAVPPDGRLLLVNMRNFGYLLNRPWTADFVFEYYRLATALEKAESAVDVDRFFKDQRVTHLMIDENVTLSPLALEPRELLLLQTFLRERTVELARDPATPGLTLRELIRTPKR